MAEFKIGDIVKLKSGSPAMTCSDIRNQFIDRIEGTEWIKEEKQLVLCKWFSGEKLESDWFDINTIDLVDEKKE